MAYLAMSIPVANSIHLHPAKGSFDRARRQSTVIDSTTITVVPFSNTRSPDQNNIRQLINSSPFHEPMFRELSLSEKPSIKDGEEADAAKWEKEIRSINLKLTAAVERMREMEVNRLKSKVGRTLSREDNLIIENTSKEIVTKLLERPIRYLSACNGTSLEDKFKDVNLLLGMLEKSCLTN